MKKLSQRHPLIKKLSKRSGPDIEKLVREMRNQAKSDPVIIEKFKEYGVPLDDIDNVSVQFCDLDVSSKTKDQSIYLSNKMLADDSNVDDPTHYLIHELVHYLQQKTGNTCDKDNKDYLDLETEEEAFKAQIDFKKREESEAKAEEYVDGLLDYHDLEGEKRKGKKEELLDPRD